MKKKLIAIAAAAVAILPVAASPASATATGEVAIVCNAHLPSFPTSLGHGTCDGTARIAVPVPGVAAGGVAGVTNGGNAYAVWTAPGATNNFSADFDYNEGCVANEPPATGSAFNASATITRLNGRVVSPGGQVTEVTNGSATINFEWTRVGLTAGIVITGGTINLGTDSASVTAGAATAAFVPVLTAANTCPDGGALEAVVVAEATIGA